MKQPTNHIIEETAIALCAEVWEQAAMQGFVMKPYKNQRQFIKKNFEKYVPKAIEVLLTMLNGEYPEEMKKTIYEAIIERGDYVPTVNGVEVPEVNKYLN